MQINKTNLNFKGYDARPLQGLMFTDKKYANVVKNLIKDLNVDIYTPNIASKSIKKDFYQLSNTKQIMWAQDYITFLKHDIKAVLFDNTRESLKRFLRATSDGIKKDLNFIPIKSEPHIRGGNFFVCDNNGKKELLINENRQPFSSDILKKIYNVDNIITIPRIDYHLDLFLRPLDKGNILVSDINMTKKGMADGILKIENYIKNNKLAPSEINQLEEIKNNIDLMIKKLDITLQFDKYKPQEKINDVVNILCKAGYNPIRVPACYHYLDRIKTKQTLQSAIDKFNTNADKLIDLSKNYSPLVQDKIKKVIEIENFKVQNDENFGAEFYNFYENNFINAIVGKKKDGSLFYITNSSLLDSKLEITPEIESKIDFSTKKMFLDSIKPYINEKNIYFIDENSTKELFNNLGGVHCVTSEIPL